MCFLLNLFWVLNKSTYNRLPGRLVFLLWLWVKSRKCPRMKNKNKVHCQPVSFMFLLFWSKLSKWPARQMFDLLYLLFNKLFIWDKYPENFYKWGIFFLKFGIFFIMTPIPSSKLEEPTYSNTTGSIRKSGPQTFL